MFVETVVDQSEMHCKNCRLVCSYCKLCTSFAQVAWTERGRIVIMNVCLNLTFKALKDAILSQKTLQHAQFKQDC
jgi:hypothetical protein